LKRLTLSVGELDECLLSFHPLETLSWKVSFGGLLKTPPSLCLFIEKTTIPVVYIRVQNLPCKLKKIHDCFNIFGYGKQLLL
jgi:hypothetical protein